MFQDSHTIVDKHNTYDKIPAKILGNFEEKLKIGNIRNPWDWYVSLWAYGCSKRGGLYSFLTKLENTSERTTNLTHSENDSELWQKLYSDAYNRSNFNVWLQLMLEEKRQIIGENYRAKKLFDFSGLLTFRYAKLYTTREGFDSIDSKPAIKLYDKEKNFMDLIIRNESLNEGIKEIAKRTNFDLEALIPIFKKYEMRTNKSSRNRDHRYYYDPKSIELVEEYESLIVNKYNYKFE